uniref:Uncharacterized protein n=1 Tax=Anguilla anguilla TaxID=7936 RepID=A0A0E9U8M6_ANGAN
MHVLQPSPRKPHLIPKTFNSEQ